MQTQFIHMYRLPLLPVQSYLCIQEDAPHRRRPVIGQTDGPVLTYASRRSHRKHIVARLPIPTNGKSLLAAYSLVGAVIAIGVAVIACLDIVAEPSWGAAWTAANAAGLAVGLFLVPKLRWFTEADYDRALWLAEEAGAGQDIMERIRVAYEEE